MGEVVQLEFFPKPSPSDIQEARKLLNRYTRMRKAAEEIGTMANPSEKWKQMQAEYQEKTESIKMAVRLIMDDEVREVIEFRFIRGIPRWGAITKYSNITDRSVDRRIARGIESVAETLKLVELI
ncbi:hypothetical protein B2I21_09875 [Chryseobacterium mucoviscidosis]|nr:hypothetical protein B2I21_09875 [Chryseobacterium mucoviscidosis]